MKRSNLLLHSLALALVVSGCKCKQDGDSAPSKESPAALKIELPGDLDLPRSTSKEAAPTEGIPIYVSRSKILVGFDRREVVVLGDRDTLAAVGVDSKFKGTDPSMIEAVRDAVEAVRKEKALGAWIPAAIAIDGSTPFKVVGEVLVTVQQSKFDRYSLVVRRDDGSLGAIALGKGHEPTSQPPPSAASAGAPPAKDASIYFGVRIGEDGFVVRAFNRELGPGCEVGGGTPTLAKKNSVYDVAALTACAQKTRERVPLSHDSFALLTATPKISFSDVVGAIDAVRAGTDGKPLFPDVGLTLVH